MDWVELSWVELRMVRFFFVYQVRGALYNYYQYTNKESGRKETRNEGKGGGDEVNFS